MHGYSSTDFTDYMVYAKDSKLVSPGHEPPFMIELEEDMPVLDGAEACYPLYAAFAKALYLDIDVIESNWLRETDEQYCNGKIVTFTNSVVGFNRLLMDDPDGSGGEIDMFFGARPSSSQMKEAEELDVQLDIVPIGREAFVFFVEEDNPVSDLTAEQVRAIYHGDITNWKELGGKDQEILAFQRPKNSGSQTMMEYFMGDVTLKEPKTFEKVDAMTGVIKEVAQYANEKGAMGYSFRYFLQELNQEKGVKMLSIDGVYPSLENIENGSYPLVTNVVLITRADETNPYVRKMTDFILSEEGQDIIRRTGYAGIK
jgi:phosphate transport system substrate-binding protein